MKKGCSKIIAFGACLLLVSLTLGKGQSFSCDGDSVFWQLGLEQEAVWQIIQDKRLPRSEQVALSGKSISVLLEYTVGRTGDLSLTRNLHLPHLPAMDSISEGQNSQGVEHDDTILPKLSMQGMAVDLPPLTAVTYDGILSFVHMPLKGLKITRQFFCSPSQPLLIEYWHLENISEVKQEIAFQFEPLSRQMEAGVESLQLVRVESDVRPDIALGPHEAYRFALYFSLSDDSTEVIRQDAESTLLERLTFWDMQGSNLALLTPDEYLNQAFEFARMSLQEGSPELPENWLLELPKKEQLKKLNDDGQLDQQIALVRLRDTLTEGHSTAAVQRLKAYACQRGLGPPRPADASTLTTPTWSESALFCQAITGGLFGVKPTSPYRFSCRPRMPKGWREMTLEGLEIYGGQVSIRTSRSRRYRGMYYITVFFNDRVVRRRRVKAGSSLSVNVEPRD